MPSIKRWCHVSQDLNRDPEYRAYLKKFGLAGARFWHGFLAMLDRTDNFLDLHRGWDWGLLAASCESKKVHMLACYEHLTNIKWLRVGVDPDMKMFIYAPNWAKYNKKREDKGSMMDSTREDENLHPNPTPSPTPKEDKNTAISDKLQASQTYSLNGLQESFEQFWQSYPKKVGKGAAEKAWAKIKPSAELVEVMVQNLGIQKQSPKWTENNGEFIPYPSKWLNEKRWLDEAMPPQSKKLKVSL